MSTSNKKEYDRLRYQRLKAHKDAQSKKWAEENYEKSLSISRKSKDKNRFGGLRMKVLKRDNFECVICRNRRSKSIIVHHIDETENRKKMNANNTMGNLITLCRSCHRSLHNKLKR